MISMEDSIADIDSVSFNEDEYRACLVQSQDVDFIDLIHSHEEATEEKEKISHLMNGKYDLITEEHKKQELLSIQMKTTEVNIEKIKDVINNLEVLSDKELSILMEKVKDSAAEKEAADIKLKQINDSIKLYNEFLQIKIETISDLFKISFISSKSEEEQNRFVTFSKQEINGERVFEALNQQGTPDDIFQQLHEKLMSSNNLIKFLVDLKKYFGSCDK